MKIALSFPGCHRRGGVERIVFECARYLASRQHEVEVFANEWELDSVWHPQYHHVAMRRQPPFLRGLSYFRNCTQALAHTDTQVLYAHGCVCPTGGIYHAHSVHRAWLNYTKQYRGAMSSARWKQRLNPLHFILLRLEALHLAQRKYQKVIAVSQSVKQDLQEYYRVPETDIVVIPNGYAAEEFNIAHREQMRLMMRSKLGYEPHDKVVVFVANELERKGFMPLLRAMASLQDSTLQLLAVGRLDAQRYASEIRAMGMENRVKFVGASNTVADFYAASDVFALPTQYEAWGLVIVEAMACGLPVLTSRLAGASITVQEGRTGELLDDPSRVPEIAEKLHSLLQNNSISPMAVSGSVTDYSWASILPRYEAVLSQYAR